MRYEGYYVTCEQGEHLETRISMGYVYDVVQVRGGEIVMSPNLARKRKRIAPSHRPVFIMPH